MTTKAETLFSHDKESLAALGRVVEHPVITERQLRKAVREMLAGYLPTAYIRLFVGKVKIK